MDKILKSFLYVEKDLIGEDILGQLIIFNPNYEKALLNRVSEKSIIKTPEYFKLYKEVKINGVDYYRLPRYTLGRLSELSYIDKTSVNSSDIEFNNNAKDRNGKVFSFNSSQIKTIEETLKILEQEKGAVIVAATGEGKTSMAIDIISKLQQKTLILVHKNSLLKQWRESLLGLTTLEKSDIGLLQQGKFIDGKVVLGSMASLMRLSIDRSVNNLFGLVIQDEVHRIGARQFLKSFTRFNPKYRLGLSATPNRADSLERVYFLHTSEHLVYHKSVRVMEADFLIRDYFREIPIMRFPKWTPYLEKLRRNIIFDPDRNDILKAYIKKAVEKGRKPLFVSFRLKHLNNIYAWCKKEFPDKNVVRFFGAEKLTKTQKSQGMKQYKYVDPSSKELLNADILIATLKKIEDGEDIPQLDTLIIGTPFSNPNTAEQLVGRIRRYVEGKNKPMVIMLYDSHSYFKMYRGFMKNVKNRFLELGMGEIKLK